MKWKIELTVDWRGALRKYRCVVEADDFNQAKRFAMYQAPPRFQLAVTEGEPFNDREQADVDAATAHFNEYGFTKRVECAPFTGPEADEYHRTLPPCD